MSNTAKQNLRNTGIPVLGALPWGCHACQFYQSKDDLLDILVPYFKAGLESNEFCLWVVTEPLSGAEAASALQKAAPDLDKRLAERQMEITIVPRTLSVKEATHSLRQAVPDLEDHLAGGAIEIISHDHWYLTEGTFEPARVVEAWKQKLDQALVKGYAGMRVQGNEAWLTKGNWKNFIKYENELNEVLSGLRMIVLCTYPLAGRNAGEIFDVAHAHEYAIAKRHGAWEVLETPELKKSKVELTNLTKELEQRVQERTAELRESESQLQLVIDTIPTMAWTVLPDGTLDFANQHWLEYSGLSLEQALQDPTGTIHPDDFPKVMEKWRTKMAAVQPFEHEMRLRRADGEYRWFLVRTVPMLDTGGKILKWYGTSTDIEDRKQIETTLRQSEDHLRLVLDTTPALIHTGRSDGYLDYFNQRWLEYVGVSLEHLQGWGWTAEIHPEDVDGMVKRWRASLASGEVFQYEARVRRADGEYRWMLHHKVPLRDGHGNIVKWYGSSVDVEDRKRAELQSRVLIDAIPQQIWSGPSDGTLDYCNDRWRSYMGLGLDELRGDGWQTMLHPEDRDRVLQAWHESVVHGTPYEQEERHRGADGTYRWFLSRGVPLRDVEGHIVRWFGTNTDIEGRKQAEEKLQQSEHRFREVTESIDEVFWLKDTGTNEIIYVSPAYEKVWGRSCESLYKAHRSWLDSVDPDDFERVEKATQRQLETDYDLEYRIIRPDGSARWIHDRAFPIRDGEGEIYRIAGVAADITTHRELEQQLRQSQKMEAFGQLAGGIAHDFNNMLSVIQMHTSLLLDEEGMNPPVKSSLQDIMATAERAGGLTRQLLTFSRREVKQARDLNLAEVVETMIKLLRRVLGEDIAIETRFASPLPVVHADPGMIEQVIMNLAVNARDAMPNGGRLSVTLKPEEIGDARTTRHPGVTPGQFVCLSVSDIGSGIAPENLSRIFEPFFTTKEVGKGTGLGLATVFGIVEQHRGWIEVESEVNRGTTFRVFLPALTSVAPSRDAEPVQPKPRGGNEAILLVEDETALRVITRIALEQHGYRVFPAPTPAAALEIWEKKRGSIDLLLTDLIMPGGMSGRELAEQLLADEPGLKVIYTSGYSEDIVSRHLHLDQGRAFLQKPCSSIALLAEVRACLDERHRTRDSSFASSA